MLRRLLEGWLDSASERSYQSPFCQILAARGQVVLHSTRHSALEFGKDVVTIDRKGVPHVYQLKGNPGSRLTLSQFRDIQSQVVQLVTQPVVFPGLRQRRHKTYLVTNGNVDEEVHRAIDDLNRGFVIQNTIGMPVELITRGQLLAWVEELGAALWPSELEDISTILSMLVADGKGHFCFELLHKALTSLLYLDKEKKAKLTANETKRRITSAALLTSISLRNFHLNENHYGIICAWTMFSAYAIAACMRYSHSYKRNAAAAVAIAQDAIFVSLSNLCEELRKREHLIEGYPLVDSVAYKARFTLITALMSVYWFWCEDIGYPKEEYKAFLDGFVAKDIKNTLLWGEACIPQLLIHHWYLRATDATINPDLLLAGLLRQVVEINTSHRGTGLPSPYFTFDDVTRHTLSSFLGLKEDPYGGCTFRSGSYFAKALLHLLVRTNLKVHCKAVWPGFSKLVSKHFLPAENWMYCLWRAPEGTNIDEQSQLTRQWQALQQEARACSVDEVPQELANNRYLLMLFTIIFPHRGIPSVIRRLGRLFNECWFITEPPIE